MTETMRLLLMLGLAGTAVTFLGSLALWFYNDERRIRRALRRVLRVEPEAMLVAQGRGRGAGFSFGSDLLAVAWDKGAWCLVYRLDEVVGAELLVDGQVAARVYRNEQRRALEGRVSSADQVTLRLIFDDPRYPDFELELWGRGDENRRDDWSPRAAIQEANRWVARVEAILRRPARPRAPAPQAQAAPTLVAAPQARPSPPPLPRAAPDEPPWDPQDEDEDDAPEAYVEPAPRPAPPPAPTPTRKPAAARREPPPWEGEPQFDFGEDDAEDRDDR